jgi:competence protein ComEC
VVGLVNAIDRIVSWRRVDGLWPAADLNPVETPPQPVSVVLWTPLAMTMGIWLYFFLPREPSLVLALVFAACAGLIWWMGRGRVIAVLIAVSLLGFAAAKLRTEYVGTLLLHASTGDVAIVGLVHDVERQSANRLTLVLEPTVIEGLSASDLPRRLRLSSFARQGIPQPGDRISAKARLFPLQGPTMPGSFEYSRQQFFAGVGGTGRVTADIVTLTTAAPLRLMPNRLLTGLRNSIGGAIRVRLDRTNAAVAEALITGERAAIPRAVNDSLQASGLAHILSISGLHMSLAAGGVYWLTRALLALFPLAALTWPIKKWAAATALVFGFAYMQLAGAQAATQRSYIMIAIVFFAILVDRPAISMRNLALAAILILALQPESAVQASFQMSFMAVLGLAAFYEWWDRKSKPEEYRIEHRAWRHVRKAGLLVLASIATSIVAGAFSSVPAAYHFGRIAPYSVLANALAIPVISLAVMPAALLSVILMPLGLEGAPLAVMGWGLDLVLAISDWVAALDGARRVIPQISMSGAVAIGVGLAALCLARGKIKLVGVALMTIGVMVAPMHAMPDVLIERTAAAAAFRNDDGELVPVQSRPSRFVVSKWLQANGEQATVKDALARPGWTCANGMCQANVRDKTVVYLLQDSSAIACGTADIVIAAFPLRGRCRSAATRIDRFDVWRNGAHAISLGAGIIDVTKARSESGERPWIVVPKPRRKP